MSDKGSISYKALVQKRGLVEDLHHELCQPLFKERHFDRLMAFCVRWCVIYKLSYRDFGYYPDCCDFVR